MKSRYGHLIQSSLFIGHRYIYFIIVFRVIVKPAGIHKPAVISIQVFKVSCCAMRSKRACLVRSSAAHAFRYSGSNQVDCPSEGICPELNRHHTLVNFQPLYAIDRHIRYPERIR